VGSSSDLAITFIGTNTPVIQSNVNTITVTVTAVPAPLFPMDSYPGGFAVNGIPNVNGKLYYFVQETDADFSNISLAELQGNVSQNVFTIQSQSDYLTYLYDSPRNLFLDVLKVNAGNYK
jgi:hypothetical protein